MSEQKKELLKIKVQVLAQGQMDTICIGLYLSLKM